MTDIVFQSRFGEVIFSAGCLAVFESFQQKKVSSAEAGGQLFGVFTEPRSVRVSVATGPSRGSLRSRFSFHPNRAAEKREIESFHQRGLHYLGDWHSHPEPRPSPSLSDENKMMQIFGASHHDLNCVLMVIVGTSEFPDALWVGAVTDSDVAPLTIRPKHADVSHPSICNPARLDRWC
ncbi:Mov34/MPN/PAD-1 family protein [Ralstonia chuxiongensis]|uniref:Mov34/MPN/PAD-1 family protein n=1 Tax=Ralstonia chuxiongensis TaxID=2957504 RepID=A0AA42BJ67_9RALS|nr:Mov34/MPN/PAD-1 family protein [Ralstonia chuxiongensis]MCP1174900.1 Mov34/MPN/PAD-1 family protein [Ralstonia chuxiongensis]